MGNYLLQHLIRISVPCGLASRRMISKAFHTGVSNFRGRCHSHKSQCLLQGCFQLLKNKISAHCIKKKKSKNTWTLAVGQPALCLHRFPIQIQPISDQKTLKKNNVSLLNICRSFLYNYSLNNTT